MIKVTFCKLDKYGATFISERMMTHIPSKGDIVDLLDSPRRFDVKEVAHHISDQAHTVVIELTER